MWNPSPYILNIHCACFEFLRAPLAKACTKWIRLEEETEAEKNIMLSVLSTIYTLHAYIHHLTMVLQCAVCIFIEEDERW